MSFICTICCLLADGLEARMEVENDTATGGRWMVFMVIVLFADGIPCRDDDSRMVWSLGEVPPRRVKQAQ